MPGPVTEMLQRSPRRRQIHWLFVLLGTLLVLTRLLPLRWTLSDRPDPTATAALSEGWRVLGAGELPTDPTRPHLASWLAASAMRLAGGAPVLGPAALPPPGLLERTRLILALVDALAWVGATLMVYVVVRDRTDERPALVAMLVMTLAPGPLAAAGEGGSSPVLGLLVLLALTRAMAILTRGLRRDYLLAGVATALACGFGYHALILLLPLLHAHLRSENRADSFLVDLEWHGRALGCMAAFLATSLVVQPQLWQPVARAVVNGPLLAVGRIPAAIHPANLLLANDLDARPALLHDPLPLPAGLPAPVVDGVPALAGMAAAVGLLPLAAGLALGLRCLWQTDLRCWRPVAVYAYLAVAGRLVAATPGPGTTAALVPPLSILCAVGLLGSLLRTRFRRQRRAYALVAVLFLIEPLGRVLVLPLAGRVTTGRRAETAALDMVRGSAVPAGGGTTAVTTLGTTVAGAVSPAWPGTEPAARGLSALRRLWSAATPASPSGLVPPGAAAAVLVYDPAALTRLAAGAPTAEAERLDALARALAALPGAVLVEPTADGTVCGPSLRLVRLRRP